INRHRTILPGASYIPPPAQDKLNPLTSSSDDFLKKLDFNSGKLDTQIVQNLSGVSPLLAKEIVQQANLGEQSAFTNSLETYKKDLLNNDFVLTIYKRNCDELHVYSINKLYIE